MDEKVIQLWDEKYAQLDGETTLKDKTLSELLCRALMDSVGQNLPRGGSILEMGCGTGFLSRRMAEQFADRDVRVTGIDASRSGIAHAEKKAGPNLEFHCCDALEFLRGGKRFSVIASMRCIQNIFEGQDDLFQLIHQALEPGGALVAVEAEVHGLNSLNAEREKLGLPPVEMVWHNKFLDQKTIEAQTSDLFDWSITPCAGTYSLITRVLYPYFVKDVAYEQPIHHYAASLPEIGSFSYFKLFLGRKRG